MDGQFNTVHDAGISSRIVTYSTTIVSSYYLVWQLRMLMRSRDRGTVANSRLFVFATLSKSSEVRRTFLGSLG